MSGLFNNIGSGSPSGPSTQPDVVTRDYVAGVQVHDAVYQTGTGEVDRASAVSVATTPVLGVVVALDTPLVGQCYVQIQGDVMGFSGLTAGRIYILSKAPGQLLWESDTGNANFPNVSGNVVQAVGVAMSPTTLLVDIQDQAEL